MKIFPKYSSDFSQITRYRGTHGVGGSGCLRPVLLIGALMLLMLLFVVAYGPIEWPDMHELLTLAGEF